MTCQCGCGEETKLAEKSSLKYGWIKGQPRRFKPGHHRRLVRPSQDNYVSARVGGITRSVHIGIAEKALGKPLPRRAHVHHVDEDKHNNAPSNLVICENCSYHRLLHARARVVRAGGNPNTEKICGCCRRCLPFERFYKNRSNSDGLGYTCRSCGPSEGRRYYWRSYEGRDGVWPSAAPEAR